MTVSRQSLQGHFQLLNDHELVAEFHSGDLTELATDVAVEELQRRNLDLSKPDIELSAKSQGTSIGGDLVCVARFLTAAEAYLLRNRLELEGIPAAVANDLMFQSITSISAGGVRVLVAETNFNRAREIVAAIESGAYALDDQTDVGSREP